MPHRKAGRVCKCGYVFTPQSMTLTISKRENGMIVKQLVCFECFNKHHSEGE